MQAKNLYKGFKSIKPDKKRIDSEGRLTGDQYEDSKAIPEKNDYRLNEYKSYSMVFSTEEGRSTLASCALTRGWHKYMLYN